MNRLTDIKNTFDTELVEIKKSNIKKAGYGAFAKKFIKKGTRLSDYKGERIDSTNIHNYELSKLETSDYRMIVGDFPNTIIIDSQDAFIDKTNWTRFVNSTKSINDASLNMYSYQYNKKIYFKSLRDINPGEELLIYYGCKFWKNCKFI